MAVDVPVANARLVSEPTRERETYKYDPFLLTNIRYNDNGEPIPSTELVTSQDTVLTALAQLGACRLNTARSLISLFDQNYQYIVAEATPTISLAPAATHEDRGEDLWLCGTAIPRVHGVCEYTLAAGDPTQFEEGDDPSKLPVILVSDLTAEPRFSCKPYCKPGTPARFYAAVPIRSHRGINIGVYCVIDTSPRDLSSWDNQSSELMRHISRSLMEHMEYRRSSHIYARHGRMIRGLGCLVEGKETLAGWHNDLEPPLPRNTSTTNVSERAKDEAVTPDAKAASTIVYVDNGESTPVEPVFAGQRSLSPARVEASAAAAAESSGQGHGGPTKQRVKGFSSPTRRQTIQDVFTRAATIAREAINAEGFVALDASVGPFSALSTPPLDLEGDPSSTQSQSASTASGDDAKAKAAELNLPCRILGFSASTVDSLGHPVPGPTNPPQVPQKFLAKLLRRYPRGKVFNFDKIGEIQSSDSSGEEDIQNMPRSPRPGAESTEEEAESQVRRRRSPWSRRAEGSMIREIFTGARSVAFVPIWDAKKERWFAGGFAYTYTTTRIFTIEGELSYLNAFGMLTMEESFRLETQMADKAKMDVLNSLSHELRSPLHGILAASELLNDTNLDVFQGNIMHTLETCSRTLLDTVEHLLAFSKVNSYIGRMRLRKNTIRGSGMRQGRARRIDSGLKSLHSHIRLDLLVGEVMESVFAGFNFQHVSVAQLAKQQNTSKPPDADANRRLDSMRAMEELGPGHIENGQLRLELGNVSIFLDVDPACSWVFHTQPGAIRRIVMNVFGNALKYTRQGSIVVSLTQAKARRRDKLRMVKITVGDTGKGIGEDYLRHELFRPFSQEDPLAAGTGLGLSLVKQITAQLKGNITLESSVGVGTLVSVSIPLLPGDPETAAVGPSGDAQDVLQAVSELQGRRVKLVGFHRGEANGSRSSHGKIGCFDNYKLAAQICRDWCKLEVVDDKETTPDLILCMEEAFDQPPAENLWPYSAPTIVICANAISSFQRSSATGNAEASRIVEFISQPIKPRKLAKAFLGTLKRRECEQPQRPKMNGSRNPSLESTKTLKGSAVAPDLRSRFQREAEKPATTLTVTTVTMSIQANGKLAPPSLPKGIPATDGKVPDPLLFLLVDDNPINLKILTSYMKKISHAYATATNGLEAFETFCQDPGRYRCVFMDISMPIMDGFEATRRIRRHEREQSLARIPIFALSGLASATAQQEALASGIDLFLTKPVKLKELSAVLEARKILQM